MCSCTSKSTNQRPTFLQPATNVFVAGQVDHTRWKTRNIDQNLQRNNVARQVEGFCISYFALNQTLYATSLATYKFKWSARATLKVKLNVQRHTLHPDEGVFLIFTPNLPRGVALQSLYRLNFFISPFLRRSIRLFWLSLIQRCSASCNSPGNKGPSLGLISFSSACVMYGVVLAGSKLALACKR